MIFVLLADGTLLICTVAGGAMTPAYSLAAPLGDVAGMGGAGEGSVRAFPHPLLTGFALVVVEGGSAFSLIELGPG